MPRPDGQERGIGRLVQRRHAAARGMDVHGLHHARLADLLPAAAPRDALQPQPRIRVIVSPQHAAPARDPAPL